MTQLCVDYSNSSKNVIKSNETISSVSYEHILAESFFSPYNCHFCKSNEELKTCKRCKLVSYCSVEHQRNNWPAHRELCNAVSKVVKRFNSSSIFDNGVGTQTWCSIRSWAMCLAEDELKRELMAVERQMFWFPASCALCHSFKVDKSLVCRTCYSVSYCSSAHKEEHEDKHSSLCLEFKLCTELSILMAKQDFSGTNLDLNLIGNNYILPNNMHEFIKKFVNIKADDLLLSVASEMLTCIATIIYSVIKSSILTLLDNELKITIVGAEISGPESSIIKYIELLFHWFPKINTISLLLIGPYNVLLNSKPVMCPSCSSKVLKITSLSQFYHNFVLTSDYSQPDLIFIFNCGFHENQDSSNDTWGPTIPYLYDSKFLTVFTSYCESEAFNDFDRFIKFKPQNRNISVMENCKPNNFRSLWPLRDWETDGMYYQNNFNSIIKTFEEGIS